MDNRKVIKKSLKLIKFKALGQDKAWYVQETTWAIYKDHREQAGGSKKGWTKPSKQWKKGHIFF